MTAGRGELLGIRSWIELARWSCRRHTGRPHVEIDIKATNCYAMHTREAAWKRDGEITRVCRLTARAWLNYGWVAEDGALAGEALILTTCRNEQLGNR